MREEGRSGEEGGEEEGVFCTLCGGLQLKVGQQNKAVVKENGNSVWLVIWMGINFLQNQRNPGFRLFTVSFLLSKIYEPK